MNLAEDIKKSIKEVLKKRYFPNTDQNAGKWDKDYITLGDSEWKKPKRGRFGIVYKALQLDDFAEVAVKEIPLDFKADYTTPGLSRQSASVKSDTAATQDFLMACQEAVLQSSEQFQHRNIVKCYKSWIEHTVDEMTYIDPESLIKFIDDDTQLTPEIRRSVTLAKGMKFYIVMKFYESNLEEVYVKAMTQERTATKRIIHQIACGLSFIHSKGYVHRDLKPKNILITELDVAIGDFGLCKRVEDGECIRGITGTPPYNTAPDEILTPKFDIWSLGVMIFELFLLSETELPPSIGQKDQALSKLVEAARSSQPEKLKKHIGIYVKQKSMKNLVARCLQVSVEGRDTAESVERCTTANDFVPTTALAVESDKPHDSGIPTAE